MSDISNGRLSRCKKRYYPQGFKMHGETGSLIQADEDKIQRKITEIKDQIKHYGPKNTFNFDETALYYTKSPIKTIAVKPVPGVKADKKRLSVGLLCSADGKFRINSCIIGHFNKPTSIKGENGNIKTN
ncbi:hypothetical protein K501DRAFT_166473 [Backusella circina FSU 941]|nr:hypothetical protein K501DRAFT_166473 [Backusella circina FSU 941]